VYCFQARRRPSATKSQREQRTDASATSARSATPKGSVHPCSRTKNIRGVKRSSAEASSGSRPGARPAKAAVAMAHAASWAIRKSPAMSQPGKARRSESGK